MKKSIVGASRAPVAALALLCLLVSTAQARAAADPLPSWNEGPAKQAIVKFVATTMTEGSPQFVSPGARFATFDQDGTTWVEHPIYTQVVFALDRVVALAPKHPEWKTTEPFKSVIAGDRQMLEYTQAASNGALMMLVLHDISTSSRSMSSGNFRLRFLTVLASLGIGAGSLLSHAETFDTRCGPPPGRVQGNFTTNIRQ